jgi:thymidylate synthase
MLKPIYLVARDLPDAWHQCIMTIVQPNNARKRKIDKGSYEGEYRLEFDFILVHVQYPSARPLIPSIPHHLKIPDPVENMDYVEQYFARYLMSAVLEKDEQYTYGERMVKVPHGEIIINQIEEIIARYKLYGYGNNQLILQIGQPSDIMLYDPPCLRHIDTRIEEGKLHFHVYFRSWDLWGGFPANLAGIQLLKEYMAGEIGVEDGELTCSSKGLHLYRYTWEMAGTRRGLSDAELYRLKEIL